MTTNHPLTLTVEQAAQVLGIGRSTAYELVRTGDLKCIHLRRRIVIPVADLAETPGVERGEIWTVVGPAQTTPTAMSPVTSARPAETFAANRNEEPAGRPTLF